jgi:ribosome-associated toxin RatA of RatAB toxin-antitoxin module
VQRVDRSPFIELLDVEGDMKRIVAEVVVQAPLDTLWDVLTDYEALPSYVPNMETCQILERQKGRVRLRQIGCSQSLLWRIAAEAELEVDEIKKSPLRREVRFRSLGGDFERLEGSWILESDVSSSAHMTTFLRYEVNATPIAGLPSQIVSYVVKAGLPSNIRAIVRVAEQRAADKLKAPVVSLESESEVLGWKERPRRSGARCRRRCQGRWHQELRQAQPGRPGRPGRHGRR